MFKLSRLLLLRSKDDTGKHAGYSENSFAIRLSQLETNGQTKKTKPKRSIKHSQFMKNPIIDTMTKESDPLKNISSSPKSHEIDDISKDDLLLLEGGVVTIESLKPPDRISQVPLIDKPRKTAVQFSGSVKQSTVDSEKSRGRNSLKSLAVTVRSELFGVEEDLIKFSWDHSEEYLVPLCLSVRLQELKLIERLEATATHSRYVGQLTKFHLKQRFALSDRHKVSVKMLHNKSKAYRSMLHRQFLTELAILSLCETRKLRVTPQLLGFLSLDEASFEESVDSLDTLHMSPKCLAIVTGLVPTTLRQYFDKQFQLCMFQGNELATLQKISAAVRHLHDLGIHHLGLNPDTIKIEITADGADRIILDGFDYSEIVGAPYKLSHMRYEVDSKSTRFQYIDSAYFRELKRASSLLEKLAGVVRAEEQMDTSKADVFSFGMICYFVITGRDPYAYFTHAETLEMVLADQRPKRPTIDRYKIERQVALEDVLDLMEGCWDANPKNRPTFSVIRSTLDTMSAVSPISAALDDETAPQAPLRDILKKRSKHIFSEKSS